MKYLIVIFAFATLGCDWSWNVPVYKRYNGIVVDKLIVPQDRALTEYYVVFKADSLSKNISVEMEWKRYINTKVGQRISFNLTESDIK